MSSQGVTGNAIVNAVEWAGVACSLAGSLLNAQGKKVSFLFWTTAALLLGFVAYKLHRPGWLALQAAGIAINIYGLLIWQGNAPTRAVGGRES